MPKVRLELLQEGMVTARDVKNMDDMLLIPSGAALTPRHINLLRTWGVAEIAVQECAATEHALEASNPNVAAEVPALERELRRRFQLLREDNEPEMEVFRLCLQRKIRALQGS
jgi:hypothetical protein